MFCSHFRDRGELDSSETGETDFSSRSSPEWNFGCRRITSNITPNGRGVLIEGSTEEDGEERNELILSVSVRRDEEADSPQSMRSSDASSISTLTGTGRTQLIQ